MLNLALFVILFTLNNEGVNGRHETKNNTIKLPARRQAEENSTGLPTRKIFMKDGRTESYFEPYWGSGEWVFLRIPGSLQTTNLLTVTLSGSPLKHDPLIYRDCDLICLRIYTKYYGAVCAQRFDTINWRIEFKQFNNLCELEKENCINPEQKWYATSRSTFCGDMVRNYPMTPEEHQKLVDRAVQQHNAIVFVLPTVSHKHG